MKQIYIRMIAEGIIEERIARKLAVFYDCR